MLQGLSGEEHEGCQKNQERKIDIHYFPFNNALDYTLSNVQGVGTFSNLAGRYGGIYHYYDKPNDLCGRSFIRSNTF